MMRQDYLQLMDIYPKKNIPVHMFAPFDKCTSDRVSLIVTHTHILTHTIINDQRSLTNSKIALTSRIFRYDSLCSSVPSKRRNYFNLTRFSFFCFHVRPLSHAGLSTSDRTLSLTQNKIESEILPVRHQKLRQRGDLTRLLFKFAVLVGFAGPRGPLLVSYLAVAISRTTT